MHRFVEMADPNVSKNYLKVLKQFMTIAIKHPTPTIAIPDCRVYCLQQNDQWMLLDNICLRREDLSPLFMDWAYDLAERNLKQKYFAFGLRWKRQPTYSNLFKYWARYLIAFDAYDYHPVGYVMFRFDFMIDHSVVYIYCVHVEDKNKGIGTHLMLSLEVLARRFGVQLLIISVPRKDVAVKRFLHRLGFTYDATKCNLSSTHEELIAPTKCYKLMCEGN